MVFWMSTNPAVALQWLKKKWATTTPPTPNFETQKGQTAIGAQQPTTTPTKGMGIWANQKNISTPMPIAPTPALNQKVFQPWAEQPTAQPIQQAPATNIQQPQAQIQPNQQAPMVSKTNIVGMWAIQWLQSAGEAMKNPEKIAQFDAKQQVRNALSKEYGIVSTNPKDFRAKVMEKENIAKTKFEQAKINGIDSLPPKDQAEMKLLDKQLRLVNEIRWSQNIPKDVTDSEILADAKLNAPERVNSTLKEEQDAYNSASWEWEHWVARNIIAWASESLAWLWEFAWSVLWNVVDRIAKKQSDQLVALWKPEQAQQFKQKINAVTSDFNNFAEKEMWGENVGDENSKVYKASKLIMDVAQVVDEWSIGLAKWAPKLAKNMVELGKSVLKKAGTNEWLIAKVIENVTPKLDELAEMWSKSELVNAQSKLTKAMNPRFSTLTNKKDIKWLIKKWETANEEIIAQWFQPKNTQERYDMHVQTMRNVWEELDSAMKTPIKIDLNPVADELEAFMKKNDSLRIVWNNETDFKAIEAQVKALRKKWAVTASEADTIKQGMQNLVTYWEKDIGQVFKNSLSDASRKLSKSLDEWLSSIPWEFQAIKDRYWALRSTLDDVMKSNIVNARKKWEGIIQTYSRLEWLSDVVWWALSIFTRWWEAIKDIWKWLAKSFIGKKLQKLQDADYLIEQWFKDLSKNIEPKVKKWFIPKQEIPLTPQIVPTRPKWLPSPETATP